MKKTNFWKTLTAGILIGSAMLCTNTLISTNTQKLNIQASAFVLRGTSQEVKLSNNALKQRLLELLDKNTNDKLYADDFLQNEHYKTTQTTDEITNITTYSAQRTYLDLSNCGITDLSELTYFEFPQTLVAIDLSGNNITNENLENISNFLNLQENDTLVYNETTITSKCDFSNQIKKVNITHNNIDLDTASTYLSNTKLLFGIQNIDTNTDGLIKKSDLEDVKYYIRAEDSLYLSYNFYYNQTKENDGRYSYTPNKVTNLLSKPCGDFKINISHIPSSTSSYFNGLDITNSFTAFDISIKPTFVVERKSMVSLNVDTNNISDMDILIDGLDYKDLSITYTDTRTDSIGTSNINLILNYRDSITFVILPLTIIDTTAPTITLKGYQKMYWKQNKDWKDPGYVGSDSGDDLTQLVTKTPSTIDTTKSGTYTITYTLTDLAGNKATTVTREVIVGEQVLDEIIITSNKDKYYINDEVILTAQPVNGTPITNYYNYEYSWYLNGVLFKTSKGDATTGKSSINLILDKTQENIITVKLSATQKINDNKVYIDSQDFVIMTNISLSDNSTIIIICTIAIVLILISIGSVYLVKIKKSKSKIASHKKSKSKNQSNTNSNKNTIQVIKNYSSNNEKKAQDTKQNRTETSTDLSQNNQSNIDTNSKTYQTKHNDNNNEFDDIDW